MSGRNRNKTIIDRDVLWTAVVAAAVTVLALEHVFASKHPGLTPDNQASEISVSTNTLPLPASDPNRRSASE